MIKWKSRYLYVSVFLLLIMFFACKKENTVNSNCSRFSITATHTESVGGANNGTITILSPRGDSIGYKLDTASLYGSSWYFTGITPGNHIVSLKNSNTGCTDTIQVKILNYGTKYAAVKQVVTGYCGPCHLNGGLSGGANFDTDSLIVSFKTRINARAVNGVPSYMPPQPNSPLTVPDMQKITDWLNAGGTTGN
jgi:hypothetical protein